MANKTFYIGSVISDNNASKSISEIAQDIFRNATENLAADMLLLTPFQRLSIGAAMLPYLLPKKKEQEVANEETTKNFSDIEQLFTSKNTTDNGKAKGKGKGKRIAAGR